MAIVEPPLGSIEIIPSDGSEGFVGYRIRFGSGFSLEPFTKGVKVSIARTPSSPTDFSSTLSVALSDNSNFQIHVRVVASRKDAEGGGANEYTLYARTHGGAITLLGKAKQIDEDGVGLSTIIDAGCTLVFSSSGLNLVLTATHPGGQQYVFSATVDVLGTSGI